MKRGWTFFNRMLDVLTPVGDLIIRLWIVDVFLKSAYTKVQTWDTTVFLFTHEYTVPFFPPAWAAFLGTGVEFIIPIFILLGFGGRLPAFILFVFNIVAIYSYPYLLTIAGAEGFEDHLYWGFLLMVLMLHGSGRLSLDHLIQKRRAKN